MQPILSIIVPVYKVEQYIRSCIESLLSQSLRNIQIILVDDGSPDKCGNICDEYAQHDNRIIVLHKENGGLSDARNKGIEMSTGKYIAFVDSDDFVNPDAFEKMVEICEQNQLDIVCGNVFVFGDGISRKKNNKLCKYYNLVMSGEEMLCKSILDGIFEQGVWANIYKSDLIKSENNKLFFVKNRLHEDTLWTPQIFLKAKKVMRINHTFYYYRLRKDSITQKLDKTKNGIDLIKTCYELADIYENLPDYNNKKILQNRLCETYFNGVYYANQYNNNYPFVKKYFVLKKVTSLKNIIKAILLLINLNLFLKVTNFFKR